MKYIEKTYLCLFFQYFPIEYCFNSFFNFYFELISKHSGYLKILFLKYNLK